MSDEKYNGWTNWETWNTHLWITDDEISYNAVCGIVKNADNKEDAARELEKYVPNSVIVIFTDNISWHKVNWEEIAEALLEE